MASDVTMSSEGSTTSRLRQFGLYKTIDSQTAEFLKLSRKRQIRRGCACAAVSTAITVTVVVCALLIYEYGFRRDFNTMAPNTMRKFNWFKTVNESNAAFNKTTPINYKNNGKLLAAILKALDQKRYLETLVEEHSSQTPAYESTTDYPFQKNVFADVNRMPSKMYEGYKSTPHEIFKTRRKDSSAKARQITDYQRVMTYLNTMPLNKRSGDTIDTDISSSTEPNFKENQNPDNNVLHDSKYQTVNAKRNETRKESYNVYCKCPPHSNLTEILEKLYISIQNLRPKAVKTAKNKENCDTQKSKANNTVTVQSSKHYSNNQTDSTSIKNVQHTTINIPPKQNTTTFTQSPVANMKSTPNSTIIQHEITTSRNENRMVKYNNNDSSHALPSSFLEEMPWKLDFGTAAYDDADGIFEHTVIKPPKNPPMERILESEASAKQSQIDEQEDFDEKLYNAVPEFAEIAHEARIHDNIRKTTEEYRSVAKYVYEISEKLQKTTIPPSVEYTTKKQLYKTPFSSQIVDPVKNVSTYTAKSTEEKEIQNRSQLGTVPPPNDTVVEPIIGSLKKQKGGIQSIKPLKLVQLLTPIKEEEKIPLATMLQSYLLSKKDNDILNLVAKSNTTSQRIELQSWDSEELPFDLNFVSNEEDEQFRLLNDLHTVKVTSKTGPRCDRNNYESESKNCRERGKKEKILSLSQVWAPMYVGSKFRSTSRKPSTLVPKSSTEAPNSAALVSNSGHKKSKMKEIFYMTGGDPVPVEDFEANLRSLMYYDKSPVNYTALSNTYVNKIESNSIELPKSMLPESRPSLLEIRRNRENFDYTTHLYTSVEQI